MKVLRRCFNCFCKAVVDLIYLNDSFQAMPLEGACEQYRQAKIGSDERKNAFQKIKTHAKTCEDWETVFPLTKSDSDDRWTAIEMILSTSQNAYASGEKIWLLTDGSERWALKRKILVCIARDRTSRQQI